MKLDKSKVQLKGDIKVRVQFSEMKKVLKDTLVFKGFQDDVADRAAMVFTQNSCDGVYSHGLNRFPRVIEYIDKGYIKVNETATTVQSFGAIEMMDGHCGLGPINAQICMDKAVTLAKQFGIGCVSIKNNNHWMRGGTYGLQAANQGYIGICFTNTSPNMPMWGALDSRTGNNPLVIAIPYGNQPIVLDMAMSQFSYGKLEDMTFKNQTLPVVGGYDKEGNLTKDPKEISETGRMLPIGFWKGSGLSFVLDLLATLLSQGSSTKDIGEMEAEYNISQVFIALDPDKFGNKEQIELKIKSTLEYIKNSEPVQEDGEVFYPSERSARVRAENIDQGIPVNEDIWTYIKQLTNRKEPK